MDPADSAPSSRPSSDGDADLVLGRRRPTGRGAWPLHARLANLALARLMRRATGVALHDLGPMRAARRATCSSRSTCRTAAAATRSRWCSRPRDAGWRIVELDVPYSPRVGPHQGDRHAPRHRHRDRAT